MSKDKFKKQRTTLKGMIETLNPSGIRSFQAHFCTSKTGRLVDYPHDAVDKADELTLGAMESLLAHLVTLKAAKDKVEAHQWDRGKILAKLKELSEDEVDLFQRLFRTPGQSTVSAIMGSSEPTRKNMQRLIENTLAKKAKEWRTIGEVKING